MAAVCRRTIWGKAGLVLRRRSLGPSLKVFEHKTAVRFALTNDAPYLALMGELWGLSRVIHAQMTPIYRERMSYCFYLARAIEMRLSQTAAIFLAMTTIDRVVCLKVDSLLTKVVSFTQIWYIHT